MIKLVILDVDGVMTDGTKYYDRDWFGMRSTNTMNVFCGVYNQIVQLIRQSKVIWG
jgi:3-deoxy-D-manno-octulosonate 8-phosphate phosphatase KdsC-like HAD superfamily phosphatase